MEDEEEHKYLSVAELSVEPPHDSGTSIDVGTEQAELLIMDPHCEGQLVMDSKKSTIGDESQQQQPLKISSPPPPSSPALVEEAAMDRGGDQDIVTGEGEPLMDNEERIIDGGEGDLPPVSPPLAPSTSATFLPGKIGDDDLKLDQDKNGVDTQEPLNIPLACGEEGRDLVAEKESKGALNSVLSPPLPRPSLPDVSQEENHGDTSAGDASHEEKVVIECETEAAFALVKNEEAEVKQADMVEGIDNMLQVPERREGLVGTEVAEESKIAEMQITEMMDTTDKSETTTAGMEASGNKQMGEMMEVAEKTVATAVGAEESVNEEVKIPETNEAEQVTEPTGAEECANEDVKIPEMDEAEQVAEPMTEMAKGIENAGMQGAEIMDEAEESEAMADMTEDTEMADMVEEEGMPGESEMTDMAEKIEGIAQIEMTEMTSEIEKSEDTDLAEVEESSRSFGGKKKRGKNAKVASRVPTRKKMEEDVCFICFDGGALVLCDRRGCPKAYHTSCVNRDEAFFRAKGRWNCGWHLCSNCEKNAHYMCYTCTFSLCKGCIKDAVIFCVRGNKGLCETCMKTVMLIERNEQGNKELGQVNFDDKTSWEYLFKDYWVGLKERFSITAEELAQAKNPWRGSDLRAGRQGSPDEVYAAHNDGGSGSEGSSGKAETAIIKKRQTRKRLRSHAKVVVSSSIATGTGIEVSFTDDGAEWASNGLLEFVMHMRNGDRSVLSQFDVQELLLEYIKRNKLRDPRRKSQIVCDSRLENLFGKPRVGHFEMLKLLESHFFMKENSQADDFQESVVDNEASQLDAEGNSDALTKVGKDKRRKSRRKGDERGLQSNLDDYAAIDMHNISLLFLRRSLVEDLIEDNGTFQDKVVGSFVRIRISGSAQKQDLYRLVQVVGTNKAAKPYKVGKRTTDFRLEILNLNKAEVISIDIISNQEFTEDECKRLRQSIKCGLINRLTVGDIQEKARALQAARVKDWLETETLRLSHLRDRASDMGHRKELRECVEKLQLLKTPEERQRRLEKVPEIHVDPHMDPSYESEEDEGEADDQRKENHVRARGSDYSMRGREPVSPRKGGFASNDSWSGMKNYSSMNPELSRNMSNKGFLNKGDVAVGAVETMNENLWSQGREKETLPLNSWDKLKAAANSETGAKNIHSAIYETVPTASDGPFTQTPTTVAQSALKINETEKIWHYKDPSGKVQGPFSMVQLRKWNNNGYFPSDLKIWRTSENQDDSMLLTDALAGKFPDPQLVGKISPSPFLSSSYARRPHGTSLQRGIEVQVSESLNYGPNRAMLTPQRLVGNSAQSAGESWKPGPESTYSTGRTSSPSLDIPNHSMDQWGSGANLPSPTPAKTIIGEAKGQGNEDNWSPTPEQPAGSLSGISTFLGGRMEQQHPTVVFAEAAQFTNSSSPSLSTKMSGGIDAANASYQGGAVPKLEMISSSGNAPLGHSQSPALGESETVQLDRHLVSALDSVGASLNSAAGTKNLGQPSGIQAPFIGTHGWGSSLVSKPDMVNSDPMPGGGSQAWGSVLPQKVEPNNAIPIPAHSTAYGNWSGTTSVHNSASSFSVGNPTMASPSPALSVMPSSDPWRLPNPGQSNTQPAIASSIPWGTSNQNAAPRQGPESQSIGWGTMPGNPNIGYGGTVPPNGNPGWVASGQAPAFGNANQGWTAPVQGQTPVNANQGWAAPVQMQASANAVMGWIPTGQGPVQVNTNQGWVAPPRGPAPANSNPNWPSPTANQGMWENEHNHNADRFSNQRDGGSQGGDFSYGGNKPWNRQSSFGSGGPSSHSFRGQRVCKFHENGHCKKGSSCDYLHN
ncbi:zinc finger CCCH domain-containing protein 19-like [Tripterygium wilfordii]|uniref:zinc finger CCCH domain-containing protein 19-like n=1 Tax=Tripterygium wilfordii TaxID=458696 RepID=UPI0018F84E31|nr:zinc finger CCCH domain-containing protein 19-like [Tripterygium wilfordii]